MIIYIDKISENTLSERDLQARFNYLSLPKGKGLPKLKLFNNILIFVIGGSVRIYSNEAEMVVLNDSQMFFWEKQSDYMCEAISDTEIILFSFDNLVSFYDKSMLQSLSGRYGEIFQTFKRLDITEPLNTFLRLLILYLKRDIDNYFLYELKQQELFFIFRTYYTREELIGFFCPLAGKAFDFRAQVLANWQKAKTVGELAQILGYGVTTFRVKFKEQFGESAYRWLLDQKAKQIIHRLAMYGDEFNKVVDDFGFSSPSHFNKFCKSRYGLTPTALREKIRKSYKN